ncbi:uncharacterized protein LOC124120438 [Haliotis rufescens]|uniref:uncharacterized protein LOC124120438 n=1 Tax=Haliotis rufescens TaxID=6454 RepID=UPI00201F9F83|nr:uncharacterized protein LOC124120438 [Haliotis rufescens]
MKVLLLVSVFISSVLAENSYTQHDFEREATLDGFQTIEPPSDIRPIQSRLKCCVLCSQDELCSAVTFHDGQCFKYSSFVSTPGSSLPGATTFHKQADSCPVSQGYTLVLSPRLCYKLYTSPWINWADSQSRCESDGGRLMILNTLQKHDYIGDFMTRTSSIHGALIGLQVYSETSYTWTDGSTFIRSGAKSSQFNAGCAYLYQTTIKTTTYTNKGWSLCEVIV